MTCATPGVLILIARVNPLPLSLYTICRTPDRTTLPININKGAPRPQAIRFPRDSPSQTHPLLALQLPPPRRPGSRPTAIIPSKTTGGKRKTPRVTTPQTPRKQEIVTGIPRTIILRTMRRTPQLNIITGALNWATVPVHNQR